MKENLTKREYFAGLAMQNLQNVLLRKSGIEMLETLKKEFKVDCGPELIALLAVVQADHLINALNCEALK